MLAFLIANSNGNNVKDNVDQNSKFEKEILKISHRIVHVLSNMHNEAISRFCFVNFCKQQQRNEQRITTQAYTATELVWLVSVAVQFVV